MLHEIKSLLHFSIFFSQFFISYSFCYFHLYLFSLFVIKWVEMKQFSVLLLLTCPSLLWLELRVRKVSQGYEKKSLHELKWDQEMENREWGPVNPWPQFQDDLISTLCLPLRVGETCFFHAFMSLYSSVNGMEDRGRRIHLSIAFSFWIWTAENLGKSPVHGSDIRGMKSHIYLINFIEE